MRVGVAGSNRICLLGCIKRILWASRKSRLITFPRSSYSILCGGDEFQTCLCFSTFEDGEMCYVEAEETPLPYLIISLQVFT